MVLRLELVQHFRKAIDREVTNQTFASLRELHKGSGFVSDCRVGARS